MDTVDGFMPLVLGLLKHPKELVKKKAVMALHRFIQIKPSLKDELDKHLRTMLCDKVCKAWLLPCLAWWHCGRHRLPAPAPSELLLPLMLAGPLRDGRCALRAARGGQGHA